MGKRVHNQLSTPGSIHGPVLMAGGRITVHGDVSGGRARSGPDIGASARKIKALLDAHPGSVPGRRMVGLALDSLADAADDDDHAEVGELWSELGPRLSELARTMAGLAAIEPLVEAISDGLA
ncbi:hypothetical protein ACFPM7_12670 [Actinokineospora guangxiensis]|uniref:Uncharacterized protein n=1 Tax=Actinokineospora guangxiensis TaxID=1490288 RepID=A0ABW0ENM8_9PSEU